MLLKNIHNKDKQFLLSDTELKFYKDKPDMAERRFPAGIGSPKVPSRHVGAPV